MLNVPAEQAQRAAAYFDDFYASGSGAPASPATSAAIVVPDALRAAAA